MISLYVNRANALSDLKRYSEAIDNYTQAIAINRLNENAFNGRGILLFIFKQIG